MFDYRLVITLTCLNSVLSSYIESPAKSHPLVEELRQVLIARGNDGSGFCDFYRRFCAVDRGASKTVFLDEFKIAFQRCNLNFSDQEISSIFFFFDFLDRKYIDYDEFFVALRGPLSDKRRNLVEKAFQQVDIEGRGMIDPETLIDRFDPNDHPDVKNNNKKPAEVFRDFLRSFDVSSEVDGKITRNEFENYYYNLSVCVERDEYFEQILTSSWRISGYDSAWEGGNYRSPNRLAYSQNDDNRRRNSSNNYSNGRRDRNNNDDTRQTPSNDENDRKYRTGPTYSTTRERSVSPGANSRASFQSERQRLERDAQF